MPAKSRFAAVRHFSRSAARAQQVFISRHILSGISGRVCVAIGREREDNAQRPWAN